MIFPNTDVAVEEQQADDSRPIYSLRSAENLDEAFAARNALVTKYLHLAASAAKATIPSGLAHFRDDAHQEACCALIEAAARFDPDRGVPFERYAYSRMVFRIRGYVRQHRFSANAERLGRAASKIWRILQETGCELSELTDLEISNRTGLTIRMVSSARPWLEVPVHLDFRSEEGSTEEVVPSDDRSLVEKIEDADRRRRLEQMLEELNPKDRYLLVTVFGLDGDDPVSIRQAVSALGCSAARGSFRVRRALKKLRSAWAD